MNDLIGKELGPYRILEPIGSGGMATVYKAYHAAMDRYVAVKVLPEQKSDEQELSMRFEQEAKVIAKLEHTHILPVHDYGQAGGRFYLAMRYIQAGTLKDRLAAGPLSLTEANRILHQVGGALDYAHRLGVVHRDVKPSNVLLDAQNECYLTDFGLARMMQSSVRLTTTGVGLGTPAYMSPEQGKGEDTDARSDIYALGVMLYEMVTGQVPYRAETPMAVVMQHITAPLPLPSQIKPDLPRPVERVILKSLAKSPDDRFQTVGEMVTAFDAAVRLAEPEPQPKPTQTQADGFFARLLTRLRQIAQTGWGRAALGAAAGVVILLIFFLILSRVPLKVQIKGGQLEVVRVVETTSTPEATTAATATQAIAARATATATPPQPTATLLATNTPTSKPSATPSPPPTPTVPPPTATSTPEATSSAVLRPGEAITAANAAQVRQTGLLEGQDSSQVLWSPDGTLLALVLGYELALHDAQSLAQVRLLKPAGWLTHVAFAPDGAVLASASNEGVQLWDTASGGELRTLPGVQSAEDLVFSPDGALLAVAVDQTVKVFDAASGQEQYLLIHGSHDVDALAFASDGVTLASSSIVDLKLWSLGNDEATHTLERDTFGWQVAFSPDGTMLASDEGDTVKLWEVSSGRALRSLSGHSDTVTAFAFSPDGAILATGSADLTIKLWEVSSGRELHTLKGHTSGIKSLTFSPDGAALLSSSADRTVRLWAVPTDAAALVPTPTRPAPLPTPTPLPLSASAISAANAAQVRQIGLLEGQDSSQVLWSPDGTLLALVLGYELALHDAPSLAQVQLLKPAGWLTHVAFAPDGVTLASASNKGVQLWDAASGGELRTLPGVQSAEDLAFSPDGALLAVAVDQTVKLFDASSGQEQYLLIHGGHDVDALAFSPDGVTLASSSIIDLKLWSLGSDEATYTLERDTFGWQVAFSPDGATLASDEGDTVKLWEVSSGRALRSLSGHSDTVTAFAFSPDGAILATGSADLTIKLWEVSSGRELYTLKGHTSNIKSLTFSPDGAALLSSSADRTVRLWAIAP